MEINKICHSVVAIESFAGTEISPTWQIQNYHWVAAVTTVWVKRGLPWKDVEQCIVQLFWAPASDSIKVNNRSHQVNTRCLMVYTNQADSLCFYFRISWILMERHWFYFFRPLHLVQGLRSIEHRLLQKLSMKNFDQKFRFFIKK